MTVKNVKSGHVLWDGNTGGLYAASANRSGNKGAWHTGIFSITWLKIR